MNIERILKAERMEPAISQAEIQSVIQNSKKVFLEQEEKRVLSFHDFLWNQFCMIGKRWWILQFILLYMAWRFLSVEPDFFHIRRGMGIFSALFVILVIPELWKNLSNRCMEIEITAYYSLRQIYAAKILLFGIADVFILTGFGGCVCICMKFSLMELIKDFLLPLVMTACICLYLLCKGYQNERTALLFCCMWSVLWWFVSGNDFFYLAIVSWIWGLVFVAACLFLMFLVHHLIKECEKYMEVKRNETVIE